MLVCVVAACVGGGYALARQSALLLLKVFEGSIAGDSLLYDVPFHLREHTFQS